MATIKVKNSAGEWVESNYKSSFKMIWVPASDNKKSYDLSPYLSEGDDFLLAFTYGDRTTNAVYLWQGSEGVLRPIDGEDVYRDNSTMSTRSPLEIIADIESAYISQTDIVYDDTERKLKYVGSSGLYGVEFGELAALIYAG